ncbi:MAG TPA: DUF1697 domain-containing protein [Candidatus Baltobacteraceae bacterium]|nr:DUF1697 domain-containing protein [Candidatus Baltobacteraceae bacterium]
MIYLALLRGVNVSGKTAPMAEVRKHVEALGFADVRTLLQSGNLIFEAPKRAPTTIETEIERILLLEMSLATTAMVRTAQELDEIITGNPFEEEAERDPSHVVAVFLKEAPAAAKGKELQASLVGAEQTALRWNTLYAVYPDGIGESKLTPALIERKLGTQATARNWNTIRKLREAMA